MLREGICLKMDAKLEQGSSLWSRDFSILFLSNFLLFFGSEILTPVLTVYMAQNGVNNVQIGIVMGSFTFSAIIIRVLAIKVTEYFGKRTFLFAGLLLCAVAAGWYYWTTAIVLILSLRVLHGLGFGAATTLYGAMVSNAIPITRLGEGMGFFGTGITIAAAIGPFLGAIAIASPNYPWVFILSAGLSVLTIILSLFTITGRESEDNEKKSGSPISLANFIEIKALFPSILALIFGVSMAGMFTFMVLFGTEANIESIGIFFLINSLAELIIRPIAGRLYDKRGHFLLLVLGALFCGVGTVILPITKGLPLLIGASTLYGVGVGMLFPVLETWALKSVTPDRRVAANATFYNFLDIGVGLGSVILGIIAQATNYATMYLYSSLVFVLFLLVYSTYYIKPNVSS
ncbi:MAG: transporter [Firmicutes bacterium]|nr:transporter [Bacillota bacterium]